MNQIIDERRTNWFWIDNEVVDRFGPQIGAYGLAVYAALARFADGHTRIAFPAIPTIATQLSVHPVSYTHMTLPTSDLVEISVVAVSLNTKRQQDNSLAICNTRTKYTNNTNHILRA